MKMSEKVILTKEQAEAINFFNNSTDTFDYLAARKTMGELFHFDYKPFNNMSLDDIAKALYSGYEIEQTKFEVGDWVIYKYDTATIMTTRIIDIQYEHNRVQFENVSGWKAIHDIERHVTKEEIFWAELGREVGEFRLGDAYCHNHDYIYTVDVEERIERVQNFYKENRLTGFYPAESFKRFSKE